MKFSDIPGMETEKKTSRFCAARSVAPCFIDPWAGRFGQIGFSPGFLVLPHVREPQDGQACGECLACLKTFKLIHPDIHYFFPLSGKDNKCDECMPDWRRAVLENPYLTAPHWQEIIAKENKLLNISADECRIMVKNYR